MVDVVVTMCHAIIMAKNYKHRFLRLILKQSDGCWYWDGNINVDGYGRFGYKGKVRKAHRVGWLLFKGPIGKKYVLHKCDVKKCVNPDHLYLGTQKQNMQDRFKSHWMRS